MTPQQVGRIARLIRHRQRLRQVDVAHRSGVSRLTVMRLEAGQVGGLTLDGIAAVFQALGGRIDLRPSWQGAALDRLLDEGHARLSGRVVEDRPVGGEAGRLDGPWSGHQARAHRGSLPPAPIPRGPPAAAIARGTAGRAVVPVRSTFPALYAEPVSRPADPAREATLSRSCLNGGQPIQGSYGTRKVSLREHLTAEQRSRGRNVPDDEHLTNIAPGRPRQLTCTGRTERVHRLTATTPRGSLLALSAREC